MAERRNEQRFRTLKKAKVVFNRRQSVVDCIVRNLSPAGAFLKLEGPTTLPTSFELEIQSENAPRQCEVIWQSYDTVGVKFRSAKDV